MDGENDEGSVIRKFRMTSADDKSYKMNHDNLSTIIAVGNKMDNSLLAVRDINHKYIVVESRRSFLYTLKSKGN